MDRAEWGRMLFYAFGIAEGAGIVGGVTYPTVETIAIVAFLLIVLPFVIGYLVAQFGLAYGLVLGIAPAIFALSALPTEFFGFSRVTDAVVLFFAYVLLSALGGFAGQRLALWRDAA